MTHRDHDGRPEGSKEDPIVSETTQIPKRLTVKPDGHENSWRVCIGPQRVGLVYKEVNREKRTTSFTFEPDAAAFARCRVDAPKGFSTRTMKDLRIELTRRIPRDDYMKILEAPLPGTEEA